jgi:hypothetical protein
VSITQKVARALVSIAIIADDARGLEEVRSIDSHLDLDFKYTIEIRYNSV